MISGKSLTRAAIYATAQYKLRLRDIHDLAELMDRDRKSYAELSSSVQIKDSAALHSGDGHPVICLVIQPVTEGLWERDCYTIEGDYYLTFSLRAQSRESFEQAMKSFEALIAAYRE